MFRIFIIPGGVLFPLPEKKGKGKICREGIKNKMENPINY